MYKPKNFSLRELIPKKLWDKMKRENIPEWKIWRMLDKNALITLQAFKKYVLANYPEYPAIIVNNYSFGYTEWLGSQIFYNSGLRLPEYPNEFTMHKLGNTFDLKFEYISKLFKTKKQRIDAYEKLRQYVINNPALFLYITVLEKGINWLHFSTGNFLMPDGSIKIILRHK